MVQVHERDIVQSHHAEASCLSNCLTTGPETWLHLWTVMDSARALDHGSGVHEACLIRQRSVVQVHLGPPLRM